MEDLISELQALEKVSHRCLLRVYELLHDDRNVYIVSELLAGGNLSDFVD